MERCFFVSVCFFVFVCLFVSIFSPSLIPSCTYNRLRGLVAIFAAFGSD